MLRITVRKENGREENWEGLPGWMVQLLMARGIETEEEARRFLHPSREQILSPMLLPGMEKAKGILEQAKKEKKQVAVYGDYDVDGVCATAILQETFEKMGLSCIAYIPDRHEEGYGLNVNAVEKLAGECQVLVTVDCGITSLEEVRIAKERGMQVIVTDHHRPGEILPPADAVISPLLENYPFPYLCGAGVAWKLSLAMLGERAESLMELAALATVADMVPLLSENRAIVALGLKQLTRTRRPGLLAVMENARIQGIISSDQVGFQIAPRMNACGRLDSARIALEMLTTREGNRARALALKMEGLNQERKDQEAQVIEAALAQVEKMDLVERKAIVVMGDGWNSGVVGLAAGRIAEKYAYPTVALSREGDTCVGSARSAGNVDIHKALSECADLFIRFGGHKQAAGLTIPSENVPAFIERLSEAVGKQTEGNPIIPEILCDSELPLSEVTVETVALLTKLEPYGMGNPAPRFLCDEAEPIALRAVGTEGKHLKCTFRQGNAIRDGVFFGGGQWAGHSEGAFRLVMTPTINEFRGKISAECRLQAMELLPLSLPNDPGREMLSVLSGETGESRAEEITPACLEELMQGQQGTLLVCRCMETAKELLHRYPHADFSLEKAMDARAYHTVMLYGSAADTCASFRHVVLCDGDRGESAAFAKACPRAKIYSLPASSAWKALLSGAFADKAALRNCYRALREKNYDTLDDFAQACGLKKCQAAFALGVLSEIDLVRAESRPFSLSLLPMAKRDPEESALYREAMKAKEEDYGVYGV